MRSKTNCTNRGGRLKPTGARPSHSKKRKGAKMLSNIIGLVSGCVTFLGGFLVVWGAVSLGLAIREQQGGAQIASAISTIAAGDHHRRRHLLRAARHVVAPRLGRAWQCCQSGSRRTSGEYTEKIVGKLSARTLACLVGGLASAVGVAAICRLVFGIEVRDAALPVMCASMPFWLAGFCKPYGLTFEKFVPLLASHALDNQALVYRSCAAIEKAGRSPKKKPHRSTSREKRAFRKKGSENYEPTKQAAQLQARG